MRALTRALGTACERLKVTDALAASVISQNWKWSPISPATIATAFEQFNSHATVITEAQRVLAHEHGHGGDKATYPLVERQLTFVHRLLTESFFEHLSHAQNPLGVLTTLLHQPRMRATSACVSALLGLHDERIGGDERRHSATDQKTFYAKGGYTYQPSDLFELGTIFSSLTLKTGITFYDLGSGYGHALFCGAAPRPDVTFKGIELMPARVAECEDAINRFGLTNLSFKAGDVTLGGFSDADVIFLFNPFPPDTQEEVASLIHQLATAKPLAIIDYGGCVTQGLTSLVPLSGIDIAPYHLVASKNFLHESCDLVGLPNPAANSTAHAKKSRRGTK